ncbi:Ubiquinone/menaquinone biosynthesis C-methylase UbiE [Rhizobiales bacterium GAS113]|nr:Ubiquinone/menaquinone biosynthesis C-methylase UbiE [Rhizobiales bacterium GAS113]
MASANEANAAQIEHWNGPAGETWVKLQTRLDRQLAPLGQMAMQFAAIRKGWHILDIGCGTGQTSLELAERAGTEGRVLGVDISRPMLELARQRARADGVANASFAEGDAQRQDFGRGAFDLVFSRFGVMFFADPVAAFANLRSALRQGGRLAFVTWRQPRDNEWVAVSMAAAFQHIPCPPASEPGAPGEFAFADRERVHAILQRAGFTDITIEPKDAIVGGSSLDLTADTTLNMGMVAAALRESPPEKREIVAAALRQALAPFDGPDGVRMGAAVWLVGATAP